ncbi:TPA: hypothetical protein ACF632_003441 [Salmonella enterica]
MKFTTENAQLARSGQSKNRGFLSVGALCSIAVHTINNAAPVFYKRLLVGCATNLTFVDLRNGVAELRGDIILDCNNSTLDDLLHNETYPVISIAGAVDPNNIYLHEVTLSTKDEREFDEQKPLDLSQLRHLVNGITESEYIAERKLTINITVADEEISKEEHQKKLNDLEALSRQSEITFDEKARYDGKGLMRYGHYRNGALMGYVTARATTYGADFNAQDLSVILEKFIEHQHNKWEEVSNRWSFDEAL